MNRLYSNSYTYFPDIPPPLPSLNPLPSLFCRPMGSTLSLSLSLPDVAAGSNSEDAGIYLEAGNVSSSEQSSSTDRLCRDLCSLLTTECSRETLYVDISRKRFVEHVWPAQLRICLVANNQEIDFESFFWVVLNSENHT